MASFVNATTATGTLRGIEVGGVNRFLGVPYGGAAGGDSRFMRPTPPPSWVGVRDAFAYGSICPQLPSDPRRPFTIMEDLDVQPGDLSEDCLNLNVWTPGLGPSAKRPVLVYFHGGGWTRLSANHHLYTGDRLARFGDVVVVTVNHRLGALGAINLVDLGAPEEFADSGHVGMLDLQQALQWVKANIENFGGDPNRVTIFGQSGGGRKASVLMAMPSANGLYHRAFVQSGSTVTQPTRDQAAALTVRLLNQLGIDRSQATTLQNVPMTTLIKAQDDIGATVGAAFGEFQPFVDGRWLPDDPFGSKAPAGAAKVPMLIGYCLNDSGWSRPNFDLDEAGLLAELTGMLGEPTARRAIDLYRGLYPDYTSYLVQTTIITDRDLQRRVLSQADRKAEQGAAPVWVYRYDWPSPWREGVYGAVHGMDMAAVFYNQNQATLASRPEAAALTEKLASTVVNFARSGDPNGGGFPRWPAYETTERAMLLIDHPQSRVAGDPARATREFWVTHEPGDLSIKCA